MNKRIVKYNPAFLSKEELVKSFVVRHAELDLIIQSIRENTTESNQHLLVIGHRGTGKTMLTLRVAEEIRQDKKLKELWYPIVFSEESYQVTTLGEFWLEAIFHLGQKTKDSRWKQTHRELSEEQDETRLRERALAQLMDFADSQKKRILLVVENLNMLLGDQISETDSWALRHTLLNEPRIMLLATATSRFQEIDNSGKAMFELFRTIELNPLDDKDCQKIWTSVTGKEPSDERIRPLQILTGGNLRLLTIISTFAVNMSLKKLLSDLMHLVDEHTEYFKSHLDNLPSIERKVYLGLAELWKPATAREVSNIARLNVNKTSSLLGRLIDRGAVVLVEEEKRTKLYQVAERMYNIYYLMRRRGAPSRRVKALIRFMVGFYEEEQLCSLSQKIAEEACKLKPELCQEHFLAYEAILENISTQSLRAKLIKATPQDFFNIPEIPHSIKRILKSVQKNLETENQDLSKQIKSKTKLYQSLKTILGYLKENKSVEAESLCRQAIKTFPNDSFLWSILGRILFIELERYNEAEAAFCKAIEFDYTNISAWVLLGILFLRQNNRKTEAKKAFYRVIELDSSEGNWAWPLIGMLCMDKFEGYDEAEKAFRKAFELEPEKLVNSRNLICILQKLGRWEEASSLLKEYFEKTDKIKDEIEGTSELIIELAKSGAAKECLEILRKSPIAMILEPLVVGLQLYVGEDVKAAAEIMEVAKDVVKRIELKKDSIQKD